MAANVVAAVAAVEQVSPGQDHQTLVKIKIQSLDESLSLFVRFNCLSVTILHTKLEIPCYPRHR